MHVPGINESAFIACHAWWRYNIVAIGLSHVVPKVWSLSERYSTEDIRY